MRESRREHWDTFWEERPVEEVYESVGDLVGELDRWADLPGLRILEVGAGSGRDSRLLASRGALVSVLDYSLPALNSSLGGRAPEGIQAIRADALQLPFQNNSFDVVFHQGLLEHFRDPVPLLKENVRVLAPGGILLVDVPQRWHYYTLVKRILIALDRWFAGWECSFSARELEGLLRDCGLEHLTTYADWPKPGLPYRALRKLLSRLRLKLPASPPQPPLFVRTGDSLRKSLRYSRAGHYSAMVIGCVARKPGDSIG
ncbi:MAG: class I SAM-dependent methyltransferase [Candidatus Krumholzibacteria bacterium]|jgi:SAM-dependent methyltransferase|nr:class I SAM-dependent methyltransferase [Candidatus Krumholzibacteria bacterium]MDP6669261.1 class I SAM-dependent methyltransferase [Candidatus Krumholzibacteria bacterium]MDP6797615.1 class I SAM-dependent methyltransferase [Candidatus Krumholzibacteria bacterium]MDP7021646.1 class I SAM-dependent methyltransferase [Candidatus Krumholzibacteria bacterium]